MDDIQARLEALGATKTGTCIVDCELYVAKPGLGEHDILVIAVVWKN